MIKKCAHCGAEFTTDKLHPRKLFCSTSCYRKYRRERAHWFEREWSAWLRDFAAGKTQSNFKEAERRD